MKTPVFDALRRFAGQNPARFFMPGHKGVPLPGCPELTGFFPYDVTELPETDNLACSESFLRDAQQRIARLFGAQETHILVNGSTVGILALLLGFLQEGDRVLVDRNCHQSVISGLILSGAVPVYLMPDPVVGFALPGTIPPARVEEAIRRCPQAKVLVLTSPNYYGVCHDLPAIAQVCRDGGLALLLDEAHGAHFAFSSRFPRPALSCGAQATVQSLHKTLPAPNQTALLHLSGEVPAVKEALGLVQTTSPSFPLLACVDRMCAELEENAAARYSRLFDQLDALFSQWSSLQNLQRLSGPNCDESRIVLNVANAGLDGNEARDVLAGQYGVIPEMADANNLVFIATPDNSDEDFLRLAKAVQALDQQAVGQIKNNAAQQAKAHAWRRSPSLEGGQISPMLPPIFSPELSPRTAWFSKKRSVPVEKAVGCICAQHIVSFPPCVPIVSFGERISSETVDFLLKNDIQKAILVL